MNPMEANRRRVDAVFEVAEKLAGIEDIVMVGGYAVSVRSRPRFSHDLDLVVAVPALIPVHDVLRSCGFEAQNRFPNPEKTQNVYKGETVRWSRTETGSTMDIMFGGLVDPKVRVWVPYEQIARGKTAEKIPNVLGLTRVPTIPTASTEVLVALKMQPGRPQDISDLLSLALRADPGKCAATALDFFGAPTTAKLLRWTIDELSSEEDRWGHSMRFQMPAGEVRKAVANARGFLESMRSTVERATSA